MEVAGIFVFLLIGLVGFLLLAAIVRYGVDSSKTSKKIDYLVNEVRTLRTEVNKLKDTKNIIDERI